MVAAIFFPVAAYILVRAILPPLSGLLVISGMVEENFRGEKTPVPLGLVFPLTVPVVYAALGFWRRDFSLPVLFLLLFYITGMGFLGLCDDVLKDTGHKGFHGHFAGLTKGNLTSGAVKALFGLGFSLVFAAGVGLWFGESLVLIVPRALVAALAANALNLFDLRPGRAVKIFFVLVFLVLLFGFYLAGGRKTVFLNFYFVLPVIGAVTAYLPYDLRARGMLGDTGANFLGAFLGGMLVLSANSLMLWGALAVLVFLHICAEKVSFTKVIENNCFLRFLDKLGRD